MRDVDWPAIAIWATVIPFILFIWLLLLMCILSLFGVVK